MMKRALAKELRARKAFELEGHDEEGNTILQTVYAYSLAEAAEHWAGYGFHVDSFHIITDAPWEG